MDVSELTIPTGADGSMGAVLARPDRPTSGGVLVLMEAFGVNEHIRDLCRRFAELGYTALAPDLYHRRGRFVTGAYDDPSGVMEHFATLDADGMAADIAAGSAFLVEEAGRFGVIGFCLGGYGAVLAAARNSPVTAVGFYGAGLSIPREGSPLAPLAPEFGSITCPIHLFYGADDPVIPAAEVDATSNALVESGVEHALQTYEGAGHGFFCDARAAYRSHAATDAWRRVVDAFTTAMPQVDT